MDLDDVDTEEIAVGEDELDVAIGFYIHGLERLVCVSHKRFRQKFFLQLIGFACRINQSTNDDMPDGQALPQRMSFRMWRTLCRRR